MKVGVGGDNPQPNIQFEVESEGSEYVMYLASNTRTTALAYVKGNGEAGFEGNANVKSTMTIEGQGFSVGGSTFAINYGSVSIGIDYYPSKLTVDGSVQWGTVAGAISTAAADGSMTLANTSGANLITLESPVPTISFSDTDSTDGKIEVNGGIMTIGSLTNPARTQINVGTGHMKVYIDGSNPASDEIFSVGSAGQTYSVVISSADETTKMMAVQGNGVVSFSTFTGTYGSGSATLCVTDAGQLFAVDGACP